MTVALEAIDALMSAKRYGQAQGLLRKLIASVQEKPPSTTIHPHASVSSLRSENDTEHSVNGRTPFLRDRARVRHSDLRNLKGSSSDTDQELPERERAHASEGQSNPLSNGGVHGLPNGLFPGLDANATGYHDGLREAMARAWHPMGGHGLNGTARHKLAQAEPLLRQLAEERGREPAELWEEAAERFRADPRVRAGRWGLPTFCSQLEQWVDRGGRELPTAEDYAREAAAEQARAERRKEHAAREGGKDGVF